VKPQYEIADIIGRYSRDFYFRYPVLAYHQRVLNALENCRTVRLGGHVEQCDECGEIRISYNSCRNRHCPKCQGARRARWIESRLSETLDCKYFHVVFTIPECLNPYCLHYPQAMYSLLFKSSQETLECFGHDGKYLGAAIGSIGILHTWGQKLDLHPHIHYLVPAGGIDNTGHWRHSRSDGKYLFPVKALSKVFRGKFVALLKAFLQSKAIEFSDALNHAIYKREWVVYAKRPFGGASQVIEYLGRYTHKIAISNHRIQSIDNGEVVFAYKDYGDGGKVKTMTLSATEFLRRFCLHILPKGFRKIRHYGLLSSRKKKDLRELQARMSVVQMKKDAVIYLHPDFRAKCCPCCGKGEMHVIMNFGANAPPFDYLFNVLNNNKLEQSISLPC
jgi:hypothetical protein